MMKYRNNIITSLDIGTTKIACVISLLDSFGRLNIQGIGVIPWDGLQKGIVTNVNKTSQTLRDAVGLAERMAGVSVNDVWVNISGDHIRSFVSTGMVTIRRRNGEITEPDRLHAIETAKTVSLPGDGRILHAIPQEFIVDGQQEIEQPVGMRGIRLEARVLLCTGTAASVQSIEKSAKKAGLTIAGIVLDPLASGCAVLSKSEINTGIVLVDIGGNVSNIAVFLENCIRYVATVGVGGIDITRDIARALQVPLKTAEEIKIRSGSIGASYAGKNMGEGSATSKGAKEVSKEKLASIIEPRIKEILLRAKEEIKKSGYNETIASGIVLTGGGVLLKGICGFAEKIFKIQVRIGVPSGFGGLVEIIESPAHATVAGLCMYGVEHAGETHESDGISVAVEGFKRILGKVMTRFT